MRRRFPFQLGVMLIVFKYQQQDTLYMLRQSSLIDKHSKCLNSIDDNVDIWNFWCHIMTSSKKCLYYTSPKIQFGVLIYMIGSSLEIKKIV